MEFIELGFKAAGGLGSLIGGGAKLVEAGLNGGGKLLEGAAPLATTALNTAGNGANIVGGGLNQGFGTVERVVREGASFVAHTAQQASGGITDVGQGALRGDRVGYDTNVGGYHERGSIGLFGSKSTTRIDRFGTFSQSKGGDGITQIFNHSSSADVGGLHTSTKGNGLWQTSTVNGFSVIAPDKPVLMAGEAVLTGITQGYRGGYNSTSKPSSRATRVQGHAPLHSGKSANLAGTVTETIRPATRLLAPIVPKAASFMQQLEGENLPEGKFSARQAAGAILQVLNQDLRTAGQFQIEQVQAVLGNVARNDGLGKKPVFEERHIANAFVYLGVTGAVTKANQAATAIQQQRAEQQGKNL